MSKALMKWIWMLVAGGVLLLFFGVMLLISYPTAASFGVLPVWAFYLAGGIISLSFFGLAAFFLVRSKKGS
ncbi:MAG TPA: hypothetical protein DIC18_00715 [Clostridiales bacterium]|nr:hypothetical protein [Clostridiales bacterium]